MMSCRIAVLYDLSDAIAHRSVLASLEDNPQ